ncbi:MAG: hypothetical protein IPI91_15020 [Flavobacteriales bacterium]|nr:hypothetical protein [Flavobacteriales bacterium]MBK7297850.1 hypothetical protein [Flavobacteriales bacterium]MBP9136922.1 hypothetical protein [Flavobacteriales bacterium]HQV51613.1 hypothetical protein [Flavobacteriales bacterium]HQX29156.1 hypothetical protein [Flavobacteriales bacterium]
MGLLLKLFHIHYNAILILIGLVGVVISLIVGVLKKQQKATLLLTLANFGWLLLVFVSVKFLPIQSVILIVAALLTLVAAVFIIRAGHPKRLLPILITIPIALFFYFLPTHERYRILCINWNYEIETDYITWDKYSWFLYQNDEFAKALEASTKARTIADQLEDSDWVQLIDAHHEAIVARAWEKYR